MDLYLRKTSSSLSPNNVAIVFSYPILMYAQKKKAPCRTRKPAKTVWMIQQKNVCLKMAWFYKPLSTGCGVFSFSFKSKSSLFKLWRRFFTVERVHRGSVWFIRVLRTCEDEEDDICLFENIIKPDAACTVQLIVWKTYGRALYVASIIIVLLQSAIQSVR